MKQSLFCTIPYPPSQNGYLRRGRGAVYQHPAAKAYKQAVALLLKTAVVTKFVKPHRLTVTLHFFRPRAIGDLDNVLKLPFDALNGVLWEDDSQVEEIHAFRLEDKSNPRVEIEVQAR